MKDVIYISIIVLVALVAFGWPKIAPLAGVTPIVDIQAELTDKEAQIADLTAQVQEMSQIEAKQVVDKDTGQVLIDLSSKDISLITSDGVQFCPCK